ncbi:MAG: WD40 repeat domain-containing protein, partial [Planctomycetia bacterium]
SFDRTIWIYRIPDGRHITTLHVDSLGVRDAAFSGPEQLVTLTGLGQLGLWSLKSGLERQTITPKFMTTMNLTTPWTISSDSSYIAFSEDRQYQTDVFDLNGQKVGAAFSGTAPAMTPDIAMLAVVNAGKVQVRSESSGEVLQTLDLPGLVADDASLVPATEEVLLRSDQGTSYLWNFSINSLQQLSESGAVVTDQAVHPVSGTIAIAQNNGTVLLKTTGSESALLLKHGLERSIINSDVNSDGWASAMFANVYGHRTKVTAIAFSTSGRLLATADADGQVRVWDLKDVNEPLSLAIKEPTSDIQQLLFSADEKQIFCRGGTGDPFSICCWNTETDTLQKTAAPLNASGFDFTENPGELLIATDTGLRLWNYDTGVESVLSTVPAKKVLSIGKYAFTLEPQNPADPKFSNAMLVRYLLADPANPERQPLNGVAYSLTADRKNQRILAVTYAYHSAAVALADNQKLSGPVKHSQQILLQRFRGATRTLVTASQEGTIAIWDLET